MALLLIDLSYLVIHRFYATRAWERHNGVAVADEVLLHHFDRTFCESLDRLCVSNGIDPVNVVFAKDCPRDKVWRRAVFPPYKASRDRSRLADNDDEAIESAFSRVLDDLIPSWRGGAAHVIAADRAEADDIFAVLSRCDRLRGWDKVIVTGDSDMLQLCDSSTRVVDAYNKRSEIRLGQLSPREFLTVKIIRGDKSDNVPRVFRRCGVSVAERLACNPDMLKRELSTDDAYKRNFALNDMLINLDNVPPSIRDAVDNIVASIGFDFLKN
jgi:5'-3' exonuclease